MLIAITLLIAPLAAQQGDPSPAARFDVASIKEVEVPDEVRARLLSCGLPGIERSGGRVHVPFSQLCGLIRVAFDAADYQVLGVPLDRGVGVDNFFQVDARVEVGTPAMDDVRAMFRSLLEERFQLRVHRELRDVPAYVLVATKGGPKLRPCTNPNAASMYITGTILSCTPPMPMSRIAQFLSRETGRPVLDRTGLEPAPFELHWLPESAQPLPDSPPTLFTAIEEQLGLKLEPARAPLHTIVVDRAERPSPN